MKDKILLVDGFAIRNTLDLQFNLLGKRNLDIDAFLHCWYIPPGEIWIDEIYEDEADTLISNYKFLHSAEDYDQAREDLKKRFKAKGNIPPFTNREEKSGEMTIKYVDGKLVREHLDPEFTAGGHDLVYDYVPKNEIWIDDKNKKEEQPYILKHELNERSSMASGETYDIAHDYVSTEEMNDRRKAGIGKYPRDANYPWVGLSNKEIIERFYIRKRL